MIKSKSDSYSYCYCRCFNLPIRFLVKIWKAKQARKPALHFAIINIFRSFIQFSWTFLSIEMIRGHKLRMCFDQTDECDILINWLNIETLFIASASKSIMARGRRWQLIAWFLLMMPLCEETKIISKLWCWVLLCCWQPDHWKLQQNQVQIDGSEAATSCHKTENGSVLWIFMKESNWEMLGAGEPDSHSQAASCEGNSYRCNDNH